MPRPLLLAALLAAGCRTVSDTSDLQAQIDDLKTSNDQLRTDVDALQAESDTLRTDADALRTDMDAVQAATQANADGLTALQDEVGAITGGIDITDLASNVDALTVAVDDHEARLAALEGAHYATEPWVEAQGYASRVDLDTLAGRVDGHDASIADLQTSTAADHLSLLGNTAAIATANGVIADHGTRLGAIETRATAWDTTLAAYLTRLDGIDTTLAAHGTRLDGDDTSISQINSAAATLTGRVDGHDTSIATLSTGVAGNTSAIGTLNTTVSGHTSALGTLNTTVSSNTSAISALTTSVSGNTSAISSLNTTVSGHTTTLSSLGTTVSGHTSTLSSLGTTVSGHTTAIATLTSDAATLKGRVDVHDTTLTSHASTLTSYGTTLSGHTTTLASYGSRIGTLESNDVTLFRRTTVYRTAIVSSDATDNGTLAGRALTFTKTSGSSTLRVSYHDNLRIYNPSGAGSSCVWEVLVNGAPCADPGPLAAQNHVGYVNTNFHRDGSVEGICRGVAAGSVTLQVVVYPAPGYPVADCHTGWYNAPAYLEAIEID